MFLFYNSFCPFQNLCLISLGYTKSLKIDMLVCALEKVRFLVSRSVIINNIQDVSLTKLSYI